MIIKAKLIKRKTDDGLVEMEDHVPIGKEYMVDLNSKGFSSGFNFELNQFWNREIIKIVSPGEGWMPTELLELEDNHGNGFM